MEWMAFEQIEGPILLHERLDAAVARISAASAGFIPEKVSGRKHVSLRHFMPTWGEAEIDNAAELEQIFKEAASPPSPNSSSS